MCTTLYVYESMRVTKGEVQWPLICTVIKPGCVRVSLPNELQNSAELYLKKKKGSWTEERFGVMLMLRLAECLGSWIKVAPCIFSFHLDRHGGVESVIWAV